MVVWGFIYYLLINVIDGLRGFFPNFPFPGHDPVSNAYNLLADLLSVGVLLGMAALLIRRFIARAPAFNFNPKTTLHPKVRVGGVRRDSAIVGLFIIFHIGSRFLGESFHLAESIDPWQPFASILVWRGRIFLRPR